MTTKTRLLVTDVWGSVFVTLFLCLLFAWAVLHSLWASQVSQTVNNLPGVRETQVGFLGREDLLEKEMATHSSILAWRIPWTEEPGGLQSMGSQRVGYNSHFTSLFKQANDL